MRAQELWLFCAASFLLAACSLSLICQEGGSRNVPFLYNTTFTDETLGPNSCILSNNSAAIGQVDLFTTFGIVCQGPSSTSNITWYGPSGSVVPRGVTSATKVFVESLNGRELRRSGTFSSAHSGVYECRVVSENGRAESLFVGIYAMRQMFQDIHIDVQAELSEDGRNAKLRLNCSVSGLPVTTVRWFFGSEQLNTSLGEFHQLIPDRSRSVYINLLTLSREELQQNSLSRNGDYTCEVFSNLTSMNATMTFHIVPVTPELQTSGSTVYWLMPSDSTTGSLGRVSYEVSYEGGHCNSSFIFTTSNTSVVVEEMVELEKGANYSLRVRAVNAFTSGEWSEPVYVQTASTRPTGVPRNLSFDLTSTTVFLTWDEVSCSERNSRITHYLISYREADRDSNSTVSIRSTGFEKNVTGLKSCTVYEISITANSEMEIGPALNLTVNTTCSISDTTVTSQLTSGSFATVPPNLELSVYIASGVGGGLVLFLSLLLCCCCCYKLCRQSTKKEKHRHHGGADDDNDYGVELDVNPLCVATSNEPVIQDFPNDLEVCEGEYVILYVSVSGNPAPVLTWYHNNESTTMDPSIEIGGDGTLSIPSMEEKHVGTYRLVVSNCHGSCFEELELTIEDEDTFTLRRVESIASMIDNAPVPVSSFEEYVALQHRKSNEAFHFQFLCLNTYTDMSTNVGTSAESRIYNRFKSIVPYDENRVTLKPEVDCQNDYINASYLDGYTPSKFIATQGPLPHTVLDFWRLVWQEKTKRIVMLCGIVESHRVKCQQYWPESGSQNYGPIGVKIIHQERLSSYVIRKFEVSRVSVEAKLEVTHYQFKEWPDHSVPDCAGELLAFLRKIMAHENGGPDNDMAEGPILVHCSAGVGRTGVFIALDIALEQARDEGRVDVIGTINNMRFQRMKMVQTLAQYVFIHDAILESLVCGDTQIDIPNFRLVLNKLRRINKETEMADLEKQFQVLKKITPQPFDVDRKTAQKYLRLNRSIDYLPREQRRVILSRAKPSHDYIHASYVDGYQHKKSYIITQGPLMNTCGDFWQMIYQFKCATIVMLSDIMEYKQEVCYQYWPGEGEVTHGMFSIELLSESKAKDIVTRKLNLTNNETRDGHEVTQYQLLHWTPDGLCADYSSVVTLMKDANSVQMQTGNHPIVVHCSGLQVPSHNKSAKPFTSDTVSRCGIFCASMTATESVKIDAAVNIYQIVKTLRAQKPGAIQTVEQYSAIFSIVLAFIDDLDAAGYFNFANVQKVT